jgi:putative membrane protein
MFNKTMAALILATSLTGSAFAAGHMSPADKSFVMKSVQGNQAEVMMGRLGLKKSHNPQIQKMSQHLITDHGTANSDLKKLAHQEGIAVPQQVNPAQKAAYRKLSALNGKSFDQAFIKEGLMDHSKDIKAYMQEMEMGKDAKVRDYAATYLPKIQDHKAMLQEIHNVH